MRIRKVINRPLDYQGDGVNVKGGITGAINANIGEGRGTVSRTSVSSHNRIVQRNGKTIVDTTSVDNLGDSHEEVQ